MVEDLQNTDKIDILCFTVTFIPKGHENLLPVSSTVMPLPFYSVYNYEKKLLRGKYKKRPQGKISLITKEPK
ncbi:unnamed protein product [Leptidea sinapis]|uniref:Uncharacterized protein n=1 Tax=Leptidea sinapis TaxID=189913 RepID=A0A5E4Q0R9_9NEOP|nr:unnamed protein product [Leptidea sinapis]